MRQLKIDKSLTDRSDHILTKYFNDISKYNTLSAEEEFLVCQRISEGDEKAKEELIKANLRFVVSVAKKYQTGNIKLIDIINEGNIGLSIAAERFDHTKGFKFISFAVWWIRQQIIQFLDNNSRPVRIPSNKLIVLNKVRRFKESFLQENGREPTELEISEELDLSIYTVQECERISLKHVSSDEPYGSVGDGDMSLKDFMVDESMHIKDFDKQKGLREKIDKALNKLSPIEKEVVIRVYGLNGGEPDSISFISESMEKSSERIRQIHINAVRKMKFNINKESLSDL